jgi:ornithine cyclodeaminase/alanine dehydrogenase-like protein (mu-crystallin family)
MAATTFLSDADVEEVLAWPELIEALREAYCTQMDDAALPRRSIARANGAWLRSLTAMPSHCRYMGAKLIAASPLARRASYLIALFDRDTTELAALMDGNRVTASRTAATSALAVDLLAPRRPLSVAVVGSGLEARNHVFAVGTVRTFRGVAVFSPTEQNRGRLAAEISATVGGGRAVSTAKEAVSGADLVIAAARSRDESPTVQGTWLAPGATVVSIGSTLPEQREVDVDVIRRAAVIVADVPAEVASETGDMIAATAAGVDVDSKLVALEAVVRGPFVVRRDPAAIVLYKSVGSARQDITVAELCLERARALGLGTRMSSTIEPVAK